MRRFAAAAALFAIGLSGYPASPASADGSHNRPPAAHRRAVSRGAAIGRESLAAVYAAGSARARVTETGPGESVIATSLLRLTRTGAAGTGADVVATDVVVTPGGGGAGHPADAATVDRLRHILDPRAAAALFTVASDVRRMGPARVAGQVAVRYRLSVELAPHPELDRAVAEEIDALRRAGLSTLTTDVWLDQVRRPVRVTVTEAAPDGAPVRTVDCRYYDWGAADA
jgi:hypothetical protein